MNRTLKRIKIKQGRGRQIIWFIIGIFTINSCWFGNLLAASAGHVVISEVQTGSTTDASKEFIELYNPQAVSQSLAGWTVEYASATGTTWTKKASLSASIVPHGFYLVATSGYAVPDAVLTSGLAASGGHVRLKDAGGQVVDLVGWGTATHAEGHAVDAPVAGGSVERLPGRLSEVAGNGQDTDDNSADFVLREVAEPQNVLSAIEDPANTPTIEPDPVDNGSAEDVTITPPVYLAVQVSEALPDPASPLSDAKDEFIELYNPNNQPVNLKGYVLRTGSSFKAYYTIGDVVIAPAGYAVFFSVDTSLSLVNSGSAVEVLDPLGTILDVTDPYPAAKTGQAWADINGVWSWTLIPTPGSANILQEKDTVPAATGSVVTKKASSVVKKTAVKKTSSKKIAAKSSKTAAKKTKTTATKTGMVASTSAITEPSALTRWLLIAAGCFTIMYAIYGFRHDLYNYYIKARRNIAARLPGRPTLPWRRDDRAS